MRETEIDNMQEHFRVGENITIGEGIQISGTTEEFWSDPALERIANALEQIVKILKTK